MKQVEFTKEQKLVLDILDTFASEVGYTNIAKWKSFLEAVKSKYKIPTPLLTLREYIKMDSLGSYHTFHFTLNNVEINIDSISDMLTDELSPLYPLTKNYYVIEDIKEDNDGNVENYHCDHYLKLAIKED